MLTVAVLCSLGLCLLCLCYAYCGCAYTLPPTTVRAALATDGQQPVLKAASAETNPNPNPSPNPDPDH